MKWLNKKTDALQHKFAQRIRDKAISRAETRIILAGKKPADFTEEDLVVIVKEEEDQIKQGLKEKGVMALLVVLGIGWFN